MSLAMDNLKSGNYNLGDITAASKELAAEFNAFKGIIKGVSPELKNSNLEMTGSTQNNGAVSETLEDAAISANRRIGVDSTSSKSLNAQILYKASHIVQEINTGMNENHSDGTRANNLIYANDAMVIMRNLLHKPR